MSGISQYFHSEEGEVVGLSWGPGDDRLYYEVHLAGDPHRGVAYDYGSDIGIDPALRPGDRAVYLRADPWSGIWVAPARRYHPELGAAFERVAVNRRHDETYRRLVERDERPDAWLARLAAETGVPVREPAEPPSERPSAPATVFLSYKSENVLLARMIHDSLRAEANAEVWFDLAQSGDSPLHDERITSWLRDSVHGCQVLTLLLTRAALGSAWVRREIEFGQERADRDPDFHFVVLKLEDMPVPAEIRGAHHVVDCSGMPEGEILENLYAAVYGRESRREWLAEQQRRGWPQYEEPPRGYEHFASAGGEARGLRWVRRDGEVGWELEYESGGEVRTARGSGPDEIVDPGIRPGDRIAFFHAFFRQPLWMRSADLELSPGEVIAEYLRVRQAPPIDRPGALRPVRTLLAHTASFFALAAPGLLLGKLTFAPGVSWWWVLVAWVAGGATTSLYEGTVFGRLEGEQSDWWGTRPGLATSLLMLLAGFVAAAVLLVSASGVWQLPWAVLAAAYLGVLLAIYLGGFAVGRLRQRRLRLDTKGA